MRYSRSSICELGRSSLLGDVRQCRSWRSALPRGINNRIRRGWDKRCIVCSFRLLWVAGFVVPPYLRIRSLSVFVKHFLKLFLKSWRLNSVLYKHCNDKGLSQSVGRSLALRPLVYRAPCAFELGGHRSNASEFFGQGKPWLGNRRRSPASVFRLRHSVCSYKKLLIHRL